MQEEQVMDPFRAEGFRAEMDLLFRFVVRLTNVHFGIQFRTETPRACLTSERGLENEPLACIHSTFHARPTCCGQNSAL